MCGSGRWPGCTGCVAVGGGLAALGVWQWEVAWLHWVCGSGGGLAGCGAVGWPGCTGCGAVGGGLAALGVWQWGGLAALGVWQ